MTRALTLQLPDDLVERLQPVADRLTAILERGLQELDAVDGGFEGVADVMDFLAGLPSPDDVLTLRPSERLQQRVQALLVRSQTVGLSPDESREWAQYEFVEHLVRKAKARAMALRARATG